MFTSLPLCSIARSLLLCCLLAGGLPLVGCASQKASLKAPELPPRHWLDEAPGVPVENKEKLNAAVPNLYDPNKIFSFEDCVFLTIQQSPMLVNSAVDLEIKKLQLTDAVWQYLPEPRMTLTATSNLTRYNEDKKDVPGDYGRTKFRVGFYASFPNPVHTYFNHQAQKIMVSLAISAHRKAIGSAIEDIARTYLTLEAKEQIIAQQKALLPLQTKLIAYWKSVENIEGHQGVALNVAQQRLREAELEIEKSQMEATMLLTKLKIMAGVETNQKLRLNTADSVAILDGFDGTRLSWQDRWNLSEDELIIRSQVKLQDYNIMVAWARYIPDMTIQLNNSPPAGQAQPPSGQEDTFVHLNFDFPLLDWGRRYRGVQQARMTKAKAFQEQAQKRNTYANKWLEAQQQYEVAQTSLKIAQSKLEVAKMEAKETHINFNEGTGAYPDVVTRENALIQAQIALINAKLNANIARLTWMTLANALQERYLGPPAKEAL